MTQNGAKHSDEYPLEISKSSSLHTPQNLQLQSLKLVEIGVGLGDLSIKLLGIAPLLSYEIDEDLCSFVLQRFAKQSLANHFDLIHADVLSLPFALALQKYESKEKGKESKADNTTKTDISSTAKYEDTSAKIHKRLEEKNASQTSPKSSWLATSPYILISNLPYYIATRIILIALKDPLCKGFVVMTQKEVADKFCASSGDSEFCALSVLAQSVGDIRKLFSVPKEAFEPMPKVTSSVFSLRKEQESFLGNFTKSSQRWLSFEKMLKHAFVSPRKKLLSNLARHYDKKQLEEIFATLGMPPDSRAHQVSTQKYHHIFTKLERIHDE